MSSKRLSLPAGTCDQICDLALEQDMPVMFDYYLDSMNKKCQIVKINDEKVLFKSPDEHTSPIMKMMSLNGVLVCLTQNSIYVIHQNLIKK